MAVFQRTPHDDIPVVSYAETEPPASLLPRLVGLAAAGVATLIGLVAVARVDWGTNGIHAPSVAVFGITFRPVTAIVTLVVALIALAAASSRGREGTLGMGVLLICVGLAIHFGGSTAARWSLGDHLAWFSGLVGAGLLVSGLFMRSTRVVERRVSHDGYVH